MYAAVLVYVSSSPAPGYQPLYEETVTLVRADSVSHAEQRARDFARARETEYLNEQGESIRWTFEHLIDVSEVSDGLGDGAEVYTRHFRNYEAYRSFEMMLSGGEGSAVSAEVRTSPGRWGPPAAGAFRAGVQ
jgi:hypothetical protein